MAVFRPKQDVCELNFNDKCFFTLPLHEDTADLLDRELSKIQKAEMKTKADIDAAYNMGLDILDTLLGDGAADQIMNIFDKPGTVEVCQVLLYIAEEWKAAYAAVLEKMKATANFEPKRRGRR